MWYCFQPADVTDPHPGGRVRLQQHSGAVPPRGERGRAQGRPPQLQLLHVRVRPGAGAARRAPRVRPERHADLSAGQRRPPDRRAGHGHRLGAPQRGRHPPFRSAGGQ